MARITAPTLVEAARGSLAREAVDELRAAELVEVDHAAELIRNGVSIWMAPEGTRSRDGRIGKLEKSGFHLAKNRASTSRSSPRSM